MKEITRIVNAQITMIKRLEDEEAEVYLEGKKEFEDSFVRTLKSDDSIDDVLVEVKDFVLDK